MLRNLNIKAVYNSEDDNILEDFYLPALKSSYSYDRAVGYFDAKMLVSAASGLAGFIANGGKMRLICGSTLTQDEYEAIQLGYIEREIKQKVAAQLDDILDAEDSLSKNQFQALTWMVKNGFLDVKIALRKHGIHHQKTGIFRDKNGESLVFQGSANETKNALLPFNYETINVFKSWIPELIEHYMPHVNSFESLWNNSTENTVVVDITDITLNKLNEKFPDVGRPSIENELELWQKYEKRKKPNAKSTASSNITPSIPEILNGQKFELKDHQLDALREWQQNNFKGIFELATGAGKTITAIYGAVKMYRSRKRLFLIIAVPYKNLARQWMENLKLFGISPIACFDSEKKWKSQLTNAVLDFNSGLSDFECAVVVDATMTSKSRTFVSSIDELRDELSDYIMFVGDECHHHGARANLNALPEKAELRIGLSATPERQGDDFGNEGLVKYYGFPVAKYSLEDALNDKVLTPYEYEIIPVELTQEESEEYISLSKRIGKMYAILKTTGGNESTEQGLNKLLLQRSKLTTGSLNKLVALRELLSEMAPVPYSLFYCAEGTIDNLSAEDDLFGIKQISAVSSILYNSGWKTSQFTYREKDRDREQIMDDFKKRKIDALVAMKCLDEGVDIPECSTAFILASSRKSRQFVQRRGRILRKSPHKTHAKIYDFMSVIALEHASDQNYGRKLIVAELERINQFAKLSMNSAKSYSKIMDYLKKYDLIHHIL